MISLVISPSARQASLDEMEEAFVALDEADRIAAVNRVAEFYVGQSRHELVGRHWADALPPLASTRFPAILADVRALVELFESVR